MKTHKFVLVFLIGVFPMHLFSQSDVYFSSGLTIEGRILDKKNNEPIAYAHIFDKSTGKGTLSNMEGYFKLNIKNRSDSVIITNIGYKNKKLEFNNNNTFFQVYLEERIQILKLVNIVAEDNSYLYDLLNDCKKNLSKKYLTSKVYYELKSFVNKKQVELVECFYNGIFNGYDLSELKLKYGRIALQQNENIVFVSVETSRAITMMKLFDRNQYLPFSPFELSKKMLKDNYFLYLSSKYCNDDKDSIYVVEFSPKNKSGSSFTGQIWINNLNKTIIKIKLNCLNAKQHPFLPLTLSDTIKNVDIEITKTFQNMDGTMFFKHIDFIYHITYKNRNDAVYKVSTNAVLYSYDSSSTFSFPYFDFADANEDLITSTMSDYLKINAMPYNDFFWKNNDELKLNEEQNKNELFYNDENSITNKTYNPLSGIVGRGLKEHPYLPWDTERIMGREFTISYPLPIDFQTANDMDSPIFIDEKCNISVKIYLDVNSYNDKTYYNTVTILDPYESSYNFNVSDRLLYFINIYFDLIEIERRKLMSEIEKSDKSVPTIKKLYEASSARISELNKEYFKDRTYGKNENDMKVWNKLVLDNLGINNFEIFNPYKKK